jgi:hypothetical protein
MTIPSNRRNCLPQRVARNSPARNAKRDADNYDQDLSLLLQQSHESAPDMTRVMRGRKALRTHDRMMHDDMRDLSASRLDNAQSSNMPPRRVPDEHHEPRLEYYRPRFAGEEDRITRVSGRETTRGWGPAPYGTQSTVAVHAIRGSRFQRHKYHFSCE